MADDPRIQHADEAGLDAILASDPEKLFVVYLWGPRCPNCEFFAKRLPGMLTQIADPRLAIVKVDVYSHPAVAQRFGVHGIPCFLLFRAGERLGKMSDFRDERFWIGVVLEKLAEVA